MDGCVVRDLRINKIPIFEREGWQSQPSLSKIGILFSCKSQNGQPLSIWLPVLLESSLNYHQERRTRDFY